MLVIEHTPEGAIGVVLNRESQTRVAEAIPQLAPLADEDDLVMLGGPVAPESVVAVGEFGDLADAGTHVVGQLGTLDPESANESLRRLRVYAGYAGWAPGQLDDELEQEAWVVVHAEDEDPFSGADIWARALERRGGAYRLLATMPQDPSQN